MLIIYVCTGRVDIWSSLHQLNNSKWSWVKKKLSFFSMWIVTKKCFSIDNLLTSRNRKVNGYLVKREKKVHSNFDWCLQCWRCNNLKPLLKIFFREGLLLWFLNNIPILLKSYNKFSSAHDLKKNWVLCHVLGDFQMFSFKWTVF